MEKLLKRKKKAETDGNKALLTSVCIDLAELYLKNSSYNAAIDEYKTVATMYKQQNKMLDYACAHRMIGETFTHLQLYDDALKHEQIYLDIAQKENNKMEEQRAYATMGHIYLTMSLCTEVANQKNLESAAINFIKSLDVCEKLSGVIAKGEQMDMMARLFANLGVVKEAQGKFSKGIELVMKSINICKKYDIFEQLERCYTTLSSLYFKTGDYSGAISNLNLAMATAGRLPQKVSLTCSSLLSKAEILVKMNDLQAAKRVLHKAYKLKTSIETDKRTIERNLKVVMAMNYAEENLLVASLDDYKTRKSLYEKLGDGCCYFKSYNTAIDYYRKMLDSAEKNNESGKSLSPCYVSLAQTYLDNKQYDKAIEFYNLDLELSHDNLSESVNTIFNITNAMDLAGKKVANVCCLYIMAAEKCTNAGSKKELGRVLERHILYLKKHLQLTEVAKLEPRLEELNYCPSDSESEAGDMEDAIALGDDMDINNITDLSSSDDEKDLTIKSTRKRCKNTGFTIKRNVKGETQLHVAAIDGNVQLVEKLLRQGHVVNIRDHAGWLPIHEACICGHLEIVRMLVDKGAAINDRGGVKCEGMTPLHDAASNGHLEVIEYLISKGASPLAKTDNGETTLSFLKSWKAGESLDSDEEALYDRVVDAISNALAKAGQQDTTRTLNRSNEALVYIEDDNSIFNVTRSKRLNQSQSSSASKSSERRNITRNSSFTLDLRRNPNAGDYFSSQESNAAMDYKNTMSQLRKPSATEPKKRKSTQKSALMSSTEVDVDDWLDDDLSIMNSTNKKKCRVNLSLKRANSSNSFTSDLDDEIAQFDDYASMDLENMEPNNAIDCSSSTSGTNVSIASKKSFFKKRKSQQTLFKSGFTRVRDSPSPVDSLLSCGSDWGSDKSANCRTQTKMSNFLTTADSSQNSREEVSMINSSMLRGQELNSTQPLIKNQMLFIDVRIDEKLFRIPFCARDLENLTISWLAKETTKRFYKKEAMKPIIEIETKNGAILCDDDVLSVLFPMGVTRCEELRAKVVKWNVPPLKERYLDACHYFNMEPINDISSVLDTTTVNLDISNKKYRENTLPIARALNRQTSLYELNLSGLLAGNKLVEVLCESLSSLTNLTILNLNTNHINSDGMYTLANSFSYTPLRSLKALDLSYNPLGNASLKHISDITHSLNLEKLYLSGVDFCSGAFSNSYNLNIAFKLENLKELEVSHNDLSYYDLRRILTFLLGDKLEVLDVGNNNVEVSGLGVDLVKMLHRGNEEKIVLKRLCLSGCKLENEDIANLKNALTRYNNCKLEYLDLSFNELSGVSLKSLLVNCPPNHLLIMGCDKLNEYISEFDSNWKFTSTNYCNILETTLDYVQDFKQCDILINMFRDIYDDRLDIQGLDEGMLTLCVCN